MEQITFHHSLPIQLRFTDADQFGHINNTAYFQYYVTSQIDYVEADFLAQVYSTDQVEVLTAITAIGT